MIVDKQDVRNGITPDLQQEIPDAEKESQEVPERQPEKPIQPLEQTQRKEQKEKEKIKEVEKQVDTGEGSQKAPPPPPPSKMMTDEEIVADLRHVMSLDKPKQVKVLVYLAFKKGVHHAFNIAKKLKDPYLLDEFHDTMVDELYDLLIKKRKIKRY
ncbi:hypothetical protein KJ903_04745 [Patescibacteria group bacterium]|nr:hypothetical protein [Patescibacteria group bacterium]